MDMVFPLFTPRCPTTETGLIASLIRVLSSTTTKGRWRRLVKVKPRKDPQIQKIIPKKAYLTRFLLKNAIRRIAGILNRCIV